jgi:hypothetical protein
MTGVQTQIKRRGAAFAGRILSFALGLLSGPWHLSLVRHLPASAGPLPPAIKNKWQATKRNVRTLTTEPAELTYEQEFLNSGKNSHPYKTNHSQLRPISSPALTVRNNSWQADETNPASLRAKCAGGNRLTYEERPPGSRKQIILAKPITPPSLILFRHRQERKGGSRTGCGMAVGVLVRQVG